MLSIIIPVYNAAKYLRPCLDSVLGQTLKDIEIICIDDGSTDESATILEEYACADSRVRVIRQDNAGQGAARNMGLELACGEYVYFLDADDELVDTNALGFLVAEMLANRLDLLFFDAETRYDIGCETSMINSSSYARRREYHDVTDGPGLFVAMSRHGEFSVSPCLFIASREFLLKRGCRFPVGVRYEDNPFTLSAILAAKRVAHRRRRLYIRNVHGGSTMTQPLTVRDIEGYARCRDFAEEQAARRDLPAAARRELRWLAVHYKWQVRRISAKLGVPFPERYPLGERLINGIRCLREHGLGYTLRRLTRRIK